MSVVADRLSGQVAPGSEARRLLPGRDDGAGMAPSPLPAAGPTPAPAASPPGAATSPQVVAPQLAVAARHLSDGPVEVSLSPSELGRVTLTLIQNDGSIIVAVTAERPETLELLRRSIGLLAGELQDLGYANPGFSFGEQRRQTPQAAAAAADSDAPRPEAPLLRDRAASLPTAEAAGLNLRL